MKGKVGAVEIATYEQSKQVLSVEHDRKCFMLYHVIPCSSRMLKMAKCPACGKEVKNAKKTWKMAGKPDKKGKRTQLTIGLYECCGKTFRNVLEKKKI
jgi:hypothetical protein